MDIPPINEPPDSPNSQTQQVSRRARRLSEAIGHSKDTIFKATTVFPFNLFPNTIVIDREKVTIINRIFFKVSEVVSLRIHDVLNVMADVGPFFGSIRIQTRYFDQSGYSITYLKRRDALKLNRILQGYVIALQKGIDC